jgi:Kef-type K+ transport system membrane component KefB/nucleotide-binding universal stress UspA family protein
MSGNVILTRARFGLLVLGLCAGVVIWPAGSANAAEAAKGPSEVIFLAELIVLMVTGRLLGEAMQRIGQASVMGMLLAGILLGPSALGWIWPDLQHQLFPRAPEQKAMIDGIAQFGVLLLLLLTGMETDLTLIRKVGRAAISISLTGVLVPFACGVALGWFIPDDLLPHAEKRLLTALFLGTALSISSIKIVAAIVREMGFMRRNLGQVIVSSAICEDTIGWVIIAITFGLAEAGRIDLVSVSKILLGTAVFMIASFTIGRRIVFFLIRWANDNFVSELPVITMILVIMGAMALTTHFIGVHTVLGAFVAGVLIGESPILSRHIDEQLRGLITAFFMPVFFGTAGLSADLTVLKDPELLLFSLALIAIASFGKFAGAFIGAEVGGLTRREGIAIACGMNARGSTEVIVATIGLSMGALSQNLFTMIVAMAVLTTMMMPPMLRWGLQRVPMTKKEKERLEREEFEARGFLPNIERALLAADDSSNGKFAARLAGLIVGRRGMPTTVMPLDSEQPEKPRAKGTKQPSTADLVKTAAGETAKPDETEQPKRTVDVMVRKSDKPVDEAVASEATKGYDVLFVGVRNTKAKGGNFHDDVSRIACAFEGPLAIAVARGRNLRNPQACPLRILVPVAGTDVSRNAAEIAIEIGRICNGSVTALYVAAKNPTRNGGRRSRRHEQAILRDIVELADRYDFQIEPAVAADVTPERAILTTARRGQHDLIVMGVSRRAGDTLNFGDTAATVLEKAEASLLFVSG